MTQYEKPSRYPSPHTAENLTLWREEVDGSLTESVATAEKWRVGLAGFVSILTGTLIIRGPANVSDLRGDWRLLVVALLVVGMLLSSIALWQALNAAAPRLRVQSFEAVIEQWPSLRARNVAVADNINRRIGVAKLLTASALASILLAILCWWMAPAPTATATVQTGQHRYCGTVTYDEDGAVITTRDGRTYHARYKNIDRVTVQTRCSS